MPSYESWIWTELLAFDNTKSDMGVGSYLKLIGFSPTGISLLLSSIDFVLLHPGMEEETELFPDICTRFGHARNENRTRQKWTNHQLGVLVSILKKNGTKVFFSIFSSYMQNRFHEEWVNSHPEMLICYDSGPSAGINVIGRLNDGTPFEDFFVPKLAKVMTDYRFDGYHAADGMSYGNKINVSDPSDTFFNFFVEKSGIKPPRVLSRDSGNAPSVLKKRMKYLFLSRKIREKWTEFCVQRWEELFLKTTEMLHRCDKEVMINSPGLCGVVDGICLNGVDLQRLASTGIDYIVTESVAANLFLIYGGHDRNFELAAQLAEIKVCLPRVKQLFLHGVKDVVESYDLIRHGTASLMREVYMMSNQFVSSGGKLHRATEGLMVCLGDGLEKHEWRFLKREWDAARSFKPVRAGELTWLFSPDIIKPLARRIAEGERMAPHLFIGRLMEKHKFQAVVAANLNELESTKGPFLIPYFDLLDARRRVKLLANRQNPLILWGEFFREEALPEKASGLLWENPSGNRIGCVFLNFPVKEQIALLSADETTSDMPFSEFIMGKMCMAMREVLDSIPHNGGLLAACDTTTRLLEMENARGDSRCALLSTELHYTRPAYKPNVRYDKIEKASSFPYGDVVIRSGLLCCSDCPLRLPPHGVAVIDFKT